MKEWEDFLSSLKDELGADIVQKWVPKLNRFDAGNIYLEAEDSFQTSWFEEHVRPRLKGFVNANGRSLKVHLLFEKRPQKVREEASENPPYSFHPSPLDPEMSLEQFVPCEKNLIILKLLQDGSSSFNPIYLYGPKGVGKTHLLMGAALAMQKQKKRIFFIRAETFTEHVVQAIRLGQMHPFRKIYRDIDVLIIDDIHIFSKKTATQEEFFHTFNTLHTAGKQILLSANCQPSGLKEVEPRLVSRFEWGICLDVVRSDWLPILHKKGQIWKTPLSEKLAYWLISTFPSDPILAFQALLFRSKGAPLSIEEGEKLLKDLLEKQRENALGPDQIVKSVATHYGITTEDILGKSQTKAIAQPRQLAMYFCRMKLEMPFQEIGKIFDRDHSTVMSSVKLAQKWIDEKKIDLSEFPSLR